MFILAGVNAFCADNYSHKSYVQAKTIKYRVTANDDKDYPCIRMDNVNNILSNSFPYDKTTGMQYAEATNPMPLSHPSYETLKKITDSVFSASDVKKYFKGDCHLFVDFRIDPNTGHAIEVKFSMHYTPKNKSILSLPVAKIEELEKALKKDLRFHIPPGGENASFLILSGCIL